MSMSDPLADMLTRIRNGQMGNKATITSPSSRLRRSVLDVLQREGFIRGYNEAELRPGVRELTIELRYHESGPVIRRLDRISRPGQRVYSGIDDLARISGGLGISILSTPQGVLSDQEARDRRVGGEVLCQVF